MKKALMYTFFIVLLSKLNAQDFKINFASDDSTANIDAVRIENLKKGTSLLIDGLDTLNLKAVLTEITDIKSNNNESLKIYPNPALDYCYFECLVKASEPVVIILYDNLGKIENQIKTYLSKGIHLFKISHLNRGMHMIKVVTTKYSYTGKIISFNQEYLKTEIVYNSKIGIAGTEMKSTNSVIEMKYNFEDRLKVTGISGVNKTILTFIPNGDTTIKFSFINCTDLDNNSYPIVAIGQQIWMGENLKTSKYNDGTSIPNITSNSSWQNDSLGAYCFYDNNVANKDIYGALYNWYTVNTKKLCPTGWHVPSYSEWDELVEYVGGQQIAGGKLKEQRWSHWETPNKGATNDVGFTALPGASRYPEGNFEGLTRACYLWTASEATSGYAWYRFLGYSQENIYVSVNNPQKSGFSVRCVLDE